MELQRFQTCFQRQSGCSTTILKQIKKDGRVLITDEVLQRQIFVLVALVKAVPQARDSPVHSVVVL